RGGAPGRQGAAALDAIAPRAPVPGQPVPERQGLRRAPARVSNHAVLPRSTLHL
ncbi:hypothetical protein IWW51_001922, partial [Coemansia sp. RSA 2702]